MRENIQLKRCIFVAFAIRNLDYKIVKLYMKKAIHTKKDILATFVRVHFLNLTVERHMSENIPVKDLLHALFVTKNLMQALP